MRLRVARKVVNGDRESNGFGTSDGTWRSGWRQSTTARAWGRCLRLHRRHFPFPVLRPLSHRKGWERAL